MLLRLTKAFVTICALPYFAVIAAWLILRATPGEEWATMGQLNAGGIVWFVPLIALLPAALIVRARWASVCLAIVLAALILCFGREFVPPLPRSAPPDAARIRVLTYNVLVSNTDYDAVVAMIEQANADVVLVQELSPEMAAAITARIGSTHSYQVLNPWGDPRGIGLWSRFPLESEERLDQGMWEGWAQAVLVNVDGTPLYLMNLHLWPIGTFDRERFARSLAEQHKQATIVRDIVAATNGAVVVAGDLNASPTNRTYGLFDQVMDDVWRDRGFGPGLTFPATLEVELLRIDYQWTRGPVTPLSATLLDAVGSDHRPLLVEYAITR